MSVQASTVITSTTPLWYATRATGIVSLILLSGSVVVGILLQTRAASERWPRLVVAGVHRNLSLLVCLFLALHIVTAEADTFAPVGWWAAWIPFVSAYRAVWLGLGTVATDLLVAVTVTSLLRTHIKAWVWRLIHWAAYLCWPLSVIHGLGTGTDSRQPVTVVLTVACVAAVLLAAVWRLATNWRSHTAIRATAATAGFAATVTGALWALTGPLQPGWSAKAGTPSPAGTTQTSASSASTVALPLSTSITGTAQSTSGAGGLETVTLSGTGTGSSGADAFTVQISGPPTADGGVRMTGSHVSFGPASAPNLYTGTVTALNGGIIDALVSDASGGKASLVFDVNINGNQVTGTLRADAGGGN